MKRYANEVLYTDVNPFEVVREISPSCLEVRPMEFVLDPTWKPEFVPGGFVGHVTNNAEQRYSYSSRPDLETRRIRLHKNGRWFDSNGSRFVLADAPRAHYDYNF